AFSISFTTSSATRPAPVPSAFPPRSFTTTAAPLRAMSSAISRPMPRPAPVTIAILPVSAVIELPSKFRRRHSTRSQRSLGRRLRTLGFLAQLLLLLGRELLEALVALAHELFLLGRELLPVLVVLPHPRAVFGRELPELLGALAELLLALGRQLLELL